MFAPVLRLLTVMIAVMGVAACAGMDPSRVDPFPPINFAKEMPPYRLDVGQLEIVPEFQSPLQRPNVEHLMPVNPEAATVRWAQDRLKPVGTAGVARVTIRDAAVTETTSGDYDRYNGALEVAIQIVNDSGVPQADVLAKANRTKSVKKSASLNERDQALYELSEGLIRDINGQMDKLIPGYMGSWIAR